MSVRITPEPGDAEREAILAALAAEEADRPTPSGWAELLLPTRGDHDVEP